VTLVHDRQDHFDLILNEAKLTAEELATAGETIPMPYDDFCFKEKATLTFVPSQTSAGVRAADLVAGFVMRYVRSVLYEEVPLVDAYHDVFRGIMELSEPSEGLGVNFVLAPLDRGRIRASLPMLRFLEKM